MNSGNPCIGCAETGFWDNGPFYERLANVVVPGIEATPDKIGGTLLVASGLGLAAHLTSVVTRKQISKLKPEGPADPSDEQKGKEG